MVKLALMAALLANVATLAVADVATWPSSFDELEDLMVLNSGFSARNFPGPLVPCNANRVPGFSIAAGFLRTAFHDMAPANAAAGTGGLDASIGFELDNPYAFANRGPAFNNTITYLSRFYSSRVSMSDLIALGTYASVRACGGPVVSIKGGRVDATEAGDLGVPDARDNGDSLTASFERMGLTQAEGIQLVACGHTLGGVHTSSFPSIVPAGSTALGNSDMDTTNSTYDNKVVTEYLDGTTKNPLVVGPDTLSQSDFRVFNLDNNATVSKMADADAYKSTCATVLGKMIDTVPSGVELTQAITPYEVKPSLLQLTLTSDTELSFTGQLRLKLVDFATADIAKVQLVYTDRDGGNSCGDCKIDATKAGEASGFDDNFVFYSFSSTLSAKSSISSFKVVVTLQSGSTKTYDNNGKSYSVEDEVFVQAPNSSLSSVDGSGNQKVTVVAAVRNGGADASLTVSTITPLSFNTLPTTSKTTVSMTKGCKTTYYTYYSATFTLASGQVASAKFDVSSGSDSDSFKSPASLPAGVAVIPACNGTIYDNSTSISSSTSTISTTTNGIYRNVTTSTSKLTAEATSTKASLTSTTSIVASTWSEWKWPVSTSPAEADPAATQVIDWDSKKNTTVIVIINENWIGAGSNNEDTHNSGKPDVVSSTSTKTATTTKKSVEATSTGTETWEVWTSTKTSVKGTSTEIWTETEPATSTKKSVEATSTSVKGATETATSVKATTETVASVKAASETAASVKGASASGAATSYSYGYGNGTTTSTSVIAKYTGAASSLSVSGGFAVTIGLVVVASFMLL